MSLHNINYPKSSKVYSQIHLRYVIGFCFFIFLIISLVTIGFSSDPDITLMRLISILPMYLCTYVFWRYKSRNGRGYLGLIHVIMLTVYHGLSELLSMIPNSRGTFYSLSAGLDITSTTNAAFVGSISLIFFSLGYFSLSRRSNRINKISVSDLPDDKQNWLDSISFVLLAVWIVFIALYQIGYLKFFEFGIFSY